MEVNSTTFNEIGNFNNPIIEHTPIQETHDDIKEIEVKLDQINHTKNDISLLITNPKIKEGKIISNIIYSIYAKNHSKPILRQYSDFCALKEKLIDQWPGIYIPNLLPNNIIDNFDNKTIESRIRILNRFCSQLSTIPFIYKSKEVQYFLSDCDDISEEMDNSSSISFKELIERYKVTIPLNVDISLYDLKKANENLFDFKLFLSDSLRNVKEYVRLAMNNKTKEIHNYICLLNVFKDYEKYAIREYTDNDTKLVFNNINNKELAEKSDKLIKGLQNPYNSLNEWLEEDEVDLLGMINAVESIEHLQSEHNRLCVKEKDIDQKIINETNPKKPKSVFASFLSFKSSEEILLELHNEKENTQIGIYYLDAIIKMVLNHIISISEGFKVEKLSDYYKHLKRFNDIQMSNNAYIIDMWKCVQKDDNIHSSSLNKDIDKEKKVEEVKTDLNKSKEENENQNAFVQKENTKYNKAPIID